MPKIAARTYNKRRKPCPKPVAMFPGDECFACKLSEAFGISHDDASNRLLKCISQTTERLAIGLGPVTWDEVVFVMQHGDVAGHA
jgi:hypothetical protein